MLFSMIIPVYNAEKYVQEAIESLIHQTVDFKQNVEIILVDDGSTDQSKDICQNYVNQYPSNIKYVYRENAGPGSARNTGFDHVSPHSDYIGFLDADDLLSEDTLEKVGSFFSRNSEIQLAVIPLYHFERIDTPHRLNYRFEQGDRVIHILEEYTAIHFHIGGCFFKAKHFLTNPDLRFQTDIKFWEDALFINTFLLEHKQYGVVSEAKYHYRRRVDEDSLVSNAWYQKSRYTEMIRRCYLTLINESKSRYNEILPYVQFLITYHIRLYLFPKNNPIIFEVLTKEEQDEFFEEFVKLIQLFDQKYIKEQDMPFYYKTYLLNLSENGWPYKENISPKKIEKQKVVITECHHRALKWTIKGHFMNKVYFMKENDRLFIQAKDKITYLPKVEIPGKLRIIWGTVVRNYEHAGFETTLPFYRSKFQFGLETESGRKYMLNKVNLKEVELN
ncbi:glycosyltransferase family 2 protein [Neobacillus sp. MER 74]|uniref:glycosyltransferase family 2 protein n=1 Tax=Neobacillus sp. MER 74 TaxID=2939566 RepID=UPI00204145E0|nr:glycosyltransferase family 2 protein [Neobacillus sp. MER 74]MCM3115326.1 glycosyltransferase family 2 protein [Neobacillus sp. MER 74]